MPVSVLEEVARSPATAARARRPSPARLAAVFGGGALVVAALFVAARALAPLGGPLAALASFACGVAAMLIIGSLAEWFVHGRLMHRRTRLPLHAMIFDLHHRAHHWTHYRPDAYLKDEVTYVPVADRPERTCSTRLEEVEAVLAQALFYAIFAVPPVAAAWLFAGNLAFVAALVAVSAAIVALAIHLHDAMHCPGHSPLERFGWFWRLDRHHYIHHIDTEANVNFLLPLGDLLLGTLRRELTGAERSRWPAYEEVRASRGLPSRPPA